MNEQKNKLLIIRGKLRGPVVMFDPGDASAVLRVYFNPTEYSLDKRTGYAEGAIPGLDSPIIQFTSGQARTLSLELLLDTYTYANKEDVREKYVTRLERLSVVDGELHAPPPCKVVWGSMEFVGVLEDLRKRYVFFLDDGTPVRARVNLTFKEYIPVELQVIRTPRSSPDRRKTRLVHEGDTLWAIAYDNYGSPAYWKVLAEANDIDDPREIKPGDEIVLPPLITEREAKPWQSA